VQDHFNRIIIDAPPRLTTACVQALCAATHVIIPTVLDKLSSEAVHNFIFQVKRLKEQGVCPHLQFGPVIGYRSGAAAAHIPDVEEDIYKTLRDAGLSKDLYRQSEAIPHKPLIAKSAGTLIAYLRSDVPQDTSDVQALYGSLAKSIEMRVTSHAS
jgi:chromosome partitioning protein